MVPLCQLMIATCLSVLYAFSLPFQTTRYNADMNSHSIHIGVVTRRVFGCVIGLVAAVSLSTSVAAEVPVEDYTLLPPTGKTTLVSLSGYAVSEGEMSRMQATPELPLYYPYKRDADWWDNLVAEQLQARMPAIMVASRGTGEGNMNPLELTGLIEALERADASPEVMKVACFLDTANWGLRAKAIAEKSFRFCGCRLVCADRVWRERSALV